MGSFLLKGNLGISGRINYNRRGAGYFYGMPEKWKNLKG